MSDEIERREEETPGEVLVREGKHLVKTEAPYQTAVVVQKARNMNKIKGELMLEADMAGEAFYYAWVVKSKKTGKKEIVEGPSIQLAVSAARLFGNCVWGADYTEDEEHYFVQGHFVDLETGFNVSRPFRQRKSPDIGGYDADRKQDIAFQIGVSKAMRNVIVRGGLPQWLIYQAMNAAKNANVTRFEAAWGKKKDREALIGKALKKFEGFGVGKKKIEKLMGPVKSWTPQILAQLYGMFQALEDKQSTVGEIFEGEGEEVDEMGEEILKEKIEAEGLDVEEVIGYAHEFMKTMNVSKGELIQYAVDDWNGFLDGYKKWAMMDHKDGDEKKDPEPSSKGGVGPNLLRGGNQGK